MLSEDVLSFLSIAIIAISVLCLVITRKEPEPVFACALVSMILFGILPLDQAFSGFSSPGLVTVACLFVIAAAIKEVGLIQLLLEKLLKEATSPKLALFRILTPVSFLSAFVNNTPIVAALIPGIRTWCRNKVDQTVWNKKRFLLPLSYAAVLGGTCSLIGTSTNLLVFGLMTSEGLENALSFFSIGVVGLPLTLLGITYLLLFSNRILKVGDSAIDPVADTREYTVEVIVGKESNLVGYSIDKAGLRNLKGLFLVEVIRKKLTLPAVSSKTVLDSGDRLVFTGMIGSISELLNKKGIYPAEDRLFNLKDGQGRSDLIEAVISGQNKLIGNSIRKLAFRKKYNASVLAVVREGRRVQGKVGDIRLRAGDTLLLIARKSFIERYQFSKDLLLMNRSYQLKSIKTSKKYWAAVSIISFVGFSISGVISVVEAAVISSLLVILTGCIDLEKARKSLDIQVLFTIGAAFGLGTGLKTSGGAALIANSILSISGNDPFALLIATYLLTMLLTELITNNAAAVIAYSLVSGVVAALEYNMLPYGITIMIAASASFISPIGYQTNLMVYSAGRYRFKDYLKLGMPLSLIAMVLTLAIVPSVWNLN